MRVTHPCPGNRPRESLVPFSRQPKSNKHQSAADNRRMSVSEGSNAGLSRSNAAQHYSRIRKQRSRRKGIKIALVAVLAVILAGGGVALAYVANINARLSEGINDDLRETLVASDMNEPFYMLLLGVDKSEERAASSEYGASDSAYRSDSIILARIDTQNKKVTLVSIHRDTKTDLGENGTQKINAAYSIGGAAYMTEVVSEFAGVPISHYAEVDFEQLTSIVDTLGGIEVDVPTDVVDSYSGANIQAGVQTLNGGQALALCRARHAYDDYGDGDSYRAANQRAVIGAIVKKVLSSDAATMASTVSQLADCVTTDLDAQTILALATEFRGMNTATDIMSGMNPTTSSYTDNIWWEISDDTAWHEMMDRVDKGLSPYENADDDPTNGVAASSETSSSTDSSGVSTDATVTVLNGTSQSGLAGTIASKLQDQGFTTTSDNAQGSYNSTLVVYNGDDYKATAESIASSLGGSAAATANDGSYSTESNIVVIVGSDLAS